MPDSPFTSHRSVMALWRSKEAMAADVGAGNWAVIKWFKRDNIPSKWWPAVLSTDKAIAAGLTVEILARLTAREVEEARA